MPTEQKVTRKLRAMLSADVKGYSILMADDEVATIKTLKAYRSIMSVCIEECGGRVVDAVGDNLLAEFGSAVDAVQCAVEVQKELKDKNRELPEDKWLEFRIGINIGDVIQDGDRLFGDGVNVAARIEGLANAGGVCISRSTYDQIKNKLKLNYEYLGEHVVKNIKEPVRVYKVLLDTESPKPLFEEKLELPNKPSIAVLPFVNMSDDPEQEYFSDGITEDLITDLSKISGLFVIARNTTFAYKNKSMNVQTIGKELRVRFILEGSIRKAGNRIRINAQLIDANTGGHLWAERYDRDLVDIFDIQDEVTQKIIVELTLNLTKSEENQLQHRSTENLKAYDCVLRGMKRYWKYTKEDHSQAQVLFEKAIYLDSDYAKAYSWLALTFLHSWTQGWNQTPQALEKAFQIANQALALNESLPEAHRVLGDVFLYQKEYKKAIFELKKAISLNPNYSGALAGLADIYNWAGSPEEAIPLIKRAMQLNPYYNAWYPYVYGVSHIFLGNNEKAVNIFERGVIHNPDFLAIHLALAGIYAEMDRNEDAKLEVKEVLRLSPDFNLRMCQEMLPLKDHDLKERLLSAISKAGLPE